MGATSGTRRQRKGLVPATLVLGWLLLSVAWVFGNPPYGSPDETQHYIRAVGVGGGRLIGEPTPWPKGGLTDVQHRWLEQLARRVEIPAGIFPGGADCFVGDISASAACNATVRSSSEAAPAGTAVGNYPPLPYLLPGLALRLAHHPNSAMWAGRLAGVGCATLFVAGATLALWRPSGHGQALAGLVVAVTPMVLFTFASLNPSSLEIAASLAFVASLLRLADGGGEELGAAVTSSAASTATGPAVAARTDPMPAAGTDPGPARTDPVPTAGGGTAPGSWATSQTQTATLARADASSPPVGGAPPPGWVWALAGVSGGVLALSRTPGALWVVLEVALFLGWVGIGRGVALVRTRPGAAVAATGLVIAGIVGNRLWEWAYGPVVPPAHPTPRLVVAAVRGTFLPTLQQMIGYFGYLQIPLPAPAYRAWELLLVLLLALGVAVSRGRRRWALAAATAVLVALPGVMLMYLLAPTGFGVQGRHVLPIAVALPVLAAEATQLGSSRRGLAGTRWLLALVALVAAPLHLLAWWLNAKRGAVGRFGPRWFFTHPQWSPPLGWTPWALLALVGAGLLVVAGVLAARGRYAGTLDPGISCDEASSGATTQPGRG